MKSFIYLFVLVLALVAANRTEAQRSPFDTSDTSCLFDTSDDVEVQIAQIENRLGQIRQQVEEITEFVSTGSQFDTSERVPVQVPTEKPPPEKPYQTVAQSPVQKLPVLYTYYIQSSVGDQYAGVFGRGAERRQTRRELRRARGGLFGLRGGC